MTIDEVDAAVERLLMEVAEDAKQYMSEYIMSAADNPTGTLAESIYNEPRGKHTRGVGSKLEYASYVDQGRGPVHVKNKTSLHWVYPRPDGKDYFAKSVGPAKGLHFIDKTKEHIDNKHYSL